MKMIDSKILAWAAMLLAIIMLVLCVAMKPLVWWQYLDVFFAFMMAFLHLLAVNFRKLTAISRQLDMAAMVCAVLFIIAFIGVWVANSFLFN